MSPRTALFLLASCLAAAAPAPSRGAAAPAEAPPIVLANDHVAYRIGADGRNLSFALKRTGKEYCAQPGRRAFLVLRKGGASCQPSACTFAEGKLTVQFAKAGVTAVVRAAARKHYFVFEVESVSDPAVEQLTLLSLPVTPSEHVSGMSGVAADAEFAAAVRALNLQAAGHVGGRPPVLSATCSREHGLVGAKVALVGCPAAEIRQVLQEVVRSEGLPWSPLGGPFALDAEENRGSYVFASVSEKNVDEWIALARRAGLAQIHFNGWATSLGHYEPRANLFPRGIAGLKATVDKVHAAGMKAGLHTLTGCISPHDPWVRPVPDKRLAVDASFTLAAPIDAKQTTLPTAEPPQAFDTMWAYGGHGNVVRIGDELMHFSGLSRKAPFGFTGCKRGAFGTKAAPHAKGATVGHLFVRYGCFQPDENSTLVDEVAGAIARVFNTCGFDMIYMDGAEGSSGGWHGVAKMRAAIFKKLKRRVLVEASSWGCPSWPFHSRIGAWDHPKWGLKRFIDVHCRANERYRKSALLPAELGWWAILGPTDYHRAELPDEIEYLCGKALGYDYPMSFQTVRPSARPWNARQDEFLTLIGHYERLRLSGYFAESVREKLRKERDEFRLVHAPDGGWHFLPTDYAEHKVTGLGDGSAAWDVTNRFGAQPAALRIQALYAVEPYDSPGAVVLADFAAEGEFPVRAAAKGVAHTLGPAAEQVKVGKTSGRVSAKSTRGARRSAWARMGKRFEPHLDLRKHGALGLWIHGDGKGQLLNLQLANPRQYYRTLDEHYVTVDFTGWRYVELLLRERDADRFGDYQWPYGGIYSIYRAPLVRNHVSELNLYLNDLPPNDRATCHLSPIKALRTRKVKLLNPSIEIGGRRIVFPVALESGSSIEFTPPADCKLRDERGAVVQDVQPQGKPLLLAAGENPVKFACEAPAGCRARARVTVITSGEPLRGRAAAAKPRPRQPSSV